MATKMACLVKSGHFNVGTLYACQKIYEDMQQKSVQSNHPFLRKRLNKLGLSCAKLRIA